MASQSLRAQPPVVGVHGANDRLTLGIIGLGITGIMAHLKLISAMSHESNVVLAMACDLYEMRRAYATAIAGLQESDACLDYRRILDRKDIDAVVIATHDPLHAQIALDALEAGKHVYCERPLARYLDEAFRVFDKVKSTGKVFQLGEQNCSGEGWHKCAELVRSGRIGALVCSRGYYCRNGGPGCDGCRMIEREFSADSIDWRKWLGPVKLRPFNAGHFYQWRMFPDYSAGLLATQASGRLLPLMLASGRPEFPIRVNCIAGHMRKDRIVQTAPGETLVPAHVQFMAEFPSGHLTTITCSWMNARSPGHTVHGQKANFSIGNMGDCIELVPETEFENEIPPESFSDLPMADLGQHLKNWFYCIRSGKQPNANIDLAIRAQTVLSLAEMSYRLHVTCLFDAKTRRVSDGTGREIPFLSYQS